MQETQPITKDMIMADVIEKFPVAAEVMSSYGLQCTDCHSNTSDTIEGGALSHGMASDQVETMLHELNEMATNGSHQQPKQEEIPLGNLTLSLTPKAAEKVKALLNAQGQEGYGLRVSVTAGGCAGLSYGLDLEQSPSEGDKVFEFSGLKVFVDPKSLQKLNGTQIDYIETLQESGFKFGNPNAKSSCGCGQSFH